VSKLTLIGKSRQKKHKDLKQLNAKFPHRTQRSSRMQDRNAFLLRSEEEEEEEEEDKFYITTRFIVMTKKPNKLMLDS